MQQPNTNRHELSKSTFMYGCQCPKRLWLHKNQPDLRDEQDDAQEAFFVQGTNVGIIARELFPGGVDASPATSFEYHQSVIDTTRYISEGKTIIYEAAFQHNGVLAAVDILEKRGSKWVVYEVKSSTSVKDPHLRDASLQYYVLKGCGIVLSELYIVYINNQYIRNGSLEPNQLFSRESVLQRAINQQAFIAEQIEELKKIIGGLQPPAMDIGKHCEDPYPCDFMGHCWKHIPENSVFDLRGRGGFDHAMALYQKGILSMDNIPDNYQVGKAQEVQLETHRNKQIIVNKTVIRDFLKELVYPLYFVDFESFNEAVPSHDGCWPYQQVPFQFSLHIVKGKEPKYFTKAEVEHKCFLAEHGTDPRRPFLDALIQNLGRKGSVIVYNKAFENSRLDELQEAFPKQSKEIEAIQDRMVDLMIPFRRKDYYSPDMKGSYSIKEVLPALVPELSYANLPINNGGTASQAFCRLRDEQDPEKIEEIRQQLLDYCEMDTWAMVKLMEKLKMI
jgi:hypothetical protein